MRSRIALERELRRCEKALRTAFDEEEKKIAYGAVQALAWALKQDAAAPSRIVETVDV